MTHLCDFCDSPLVGEVVYDDKISAGRRRLALTGLLRMECPACGVEYVTPEQMQHNHALFDASASKTAEAVTVGHLRTLRCRWNLTQRTASALFGAGASAFGKWEAGQLPSGPAALLIQCANNVSGVIEYLAYLQGASLPGCPELSDWHAVDGQVTGVLPVMKQMTKPTASVATAPAAQKFVKPEYERDVVELYGEAA